MPWQTLIKVSELQDGQGLSVEVHGRRKPVALFRWAGQFFAVIDECTHANAPLSDGKVNDFVVTCPSHGAQFDIRTGQGIEPLAYPALKTFSVRVVGDDVQIEI